MRIQSVYLAAEAPASADLKTSAAILAYQNERDHAHSADHTDFATDGVARRTTPLTIMP
jgi:hypothetical protein